MADRYWVGGTGTWDATSTANWSETSGGAGGTSAPTLADNAYFDGGSDSGAAFTVTIGTGAVCKDLIIGDGITVSLLDWVMTLAGTASLSVYGSLFFPASNLTRSHTGSVFLKATTTGNKITTQGLVGGSWDFSSPTGGWTLGSALTLPNGFINITAALFFDTAGYNMTAQFGVMTGSNNTNEIRNIYLRSSVLSGNKYFGSVWAGSRTFVDAGTSTIRGFNTFRANAGKAFHNVICEGLNIQEFGPEGATFNSVEFVTGYLSGGFTTNELKITAPTSSNSLSVNFIEDVNVTGTFSANSGNSDLTRRWRIASNVQGTPRTITAAAIDFGEGLDFEDIVAAGASIPWDVSAKNGSNCGGNTNITFPAPKTVYWNLAGTQNWSANGWALTSGGAPAVTNFPLVQDTVVFDNSSAGTRVNMNANYRIGTINFTARTTPITFSGEGVAPQLYVDFLLSSAVTLTGAPTVGQHWTFRGRGIQNIRTAGIEFVKAIEVNAPLGTFNLLDPLTINISAYFGFIFNAGTINLNDFDLTSNGASGFNSPSSVPRHINFGSAKIVGRNTCNVRCLEADPGRVTATGTKLFWVENYNGSTIAVGGQTVDDPASNFNLHINSVAPGVTLIALVDSFRSNDFSIAEGISVPLRLGQVRAAFHGNVTIPASVPEIQQFNLGASGIPGGFTFRGANNQTLTVNGQTVQGWIDSQKSGGTLTIANDTAVNGGAALSNGTINLNGKKLTTTSFWSSNTNARTLSMSGGTLELTGSGATVFNAATATNLNIAGSGTINMTGSSSKTFAGGGANYSGIILNQSGSGELTITGNNQFGGVSNTIRPASIKFTAGSTTTLGKFMLNGSEGSPITISSTTTGTKYTLTSPAGVHAPYYASIRDANAAGGATWRAPTNYGNVNVGNNLGWDFSNINILTDNFMVLFPSNLHFTS